MKALVYNAPLDVRIVDKPVPTIEDPEDMILKVTSSAICGSDLHLYHGKVLGMKPGQVLGHEFMGIVEEVGSGVHEVQKGDRVVVPFNISCGKCYYCRRQLYSQCDRSNPNGRVGAAFGYSSLLGGFDGGQAEYVRVPFADTAALKIPDQLKDEQVLFLSDILPTGYFAADMADVKPGDDVTVFGAGPVGYFAVMSCFLRGAARVFSVDRVPSRLEKTKDLGADTINFDMLDPVMIIREATKRKGTVCIDAVGYEAIGHMLSPSVEKPAFPNENPLQVINWIGNVARKFSTVSIPGVYQGLFDHFPLGRMFDLELQIRMGQCPVKAYNEQLLHLIEMGRIDPTPIISDTIGLEDAPKYYAKFNEKDGVTKVILKPGA